MIEIYKHTNETKYLEVAKNLVTVCDEYFCPWDDKNDEALLNFASERTSDHTHRALIYGDYYFFRAVCELSRFEN